MAIGIAAGSIIFIVCIACGLLIVAVRLLIFAVWLLCFGVRAFAAGWRSGPGFAEAWQKGRERAARAGVLQRERSRERDARIEAWGRARREKDLAWMERHWATRWCARLNRRLLG